jgi:serine/threonine protein kinase
MLHEAISGAETTLPAIPRQRTIELSTIDRARYRIVRELARGGMGRVSLAYDNALGRTVALKELLGTGAGHDGSLAERFERELALTARLQHPGIACVHDGGMWPSGELVLVMRVVEGEPLDRAIARATTAASRLALVPHLIAACDAVAYAHARGIVHRDLKPANILAGEFGETVVIDWGLAIDLAEDHGRDIVGTPGYIAPEHAAGEPASERADVYALGCVLEDLLAGIDAPYELVAIASKARSRRRSDRHANAAELGAALELKRRPSALHNAARRSRLRA